MPKPNKVYLQFLIIIIVGLFFIFAGNAIASDDFGLDDAVSGTPLADQSTTTVPQALGLLINAALGITGSVFMFLTVYGGFIMMTSAGDSEKTKKGRQIIIWAVIGVVVVLAAYALTQLIFGAFGFV